MSGIKDGDKLPPFPFKVVCIDNTGRENLLVKGQIYTVIRVYGDNDSHIAGPDLILDNIEFTFATRRFNIISNIEEDTMNWRTWRDHGLAPGECCCRIQRTQCWIHK